LHRCQAGDFDFFEQIEADLAIGANHLFHAIDFLDVGGFDGNLVRGVHDISFIGNIVRTGGFENAAGSFGVWRALKSGRAADEQEKGSNASDEPCHFHINLASLTPGTDRDNAKHRCIARIGHRPD